MNIQFIQKKVDNERKNNKEKMRGMENKSQDDRFKSE